MSSASETLLRIQGEKSPLIGLLEGLAGGISSAQQNQYVRAKAILDLQQQREQQQRMEEQDRMLRQQIEQQTKQNLNATQTGQPVLPAQKFQMGISSKDGYLAPDWKVVEPKVPKDLEEINAQRVQRGEISIEEAYKMKNRAQQSGLPKPPPGYRFTADGSALEAIPGGPAEAKIDKAKSAIDTTLELYETARQGLMSGLENSVTGPFSGRIPAVTANQQIAEGGVAAMAPIMKQLFRAAGEGVFTDRDQALLLDMIPKRTDHPKAIKEKILNIDNIVKAKLGRSPSAAGGGSAVPEVGGTFNGEKVLKVERID